MRLAGVEQKADRGLVNLLHGAVELPALVERLVARRILIKTHHEERRAQLGQGELAITRRQESL